MEQKPPACATFVRFANGQMIVTLSDRREIRAPLDWFPKLLAAREGVLRKWKLLDKGARVHWTELDETVWVSALLKP